MPDSGCGGIYPSTGISCTPTGRSPETNRRSGRNWARPSRPSVTWKNELVSACYSLTAPPANSNDLRPEKVPAYLKWYTEVEAFRGDAMYVLTERFGKLLKEDGRIPHAVRTDLRARLDELRHWRNALCHGAWFGFSGEGAGVLSHYYREGKRIVQFPPMVTLQDLADLRARIVDGTTQVAETSSVAGSSSALAVVLPRKYEPRNREPEQE